ncbi:hypothetical protein Syun_019498 [Stephania yunnanensis]|uniref:Protein PLASTID TRANSCRIPTIONALLY ACTIVE 7 n=1 Tax=Stephania yunnanensis TaxID=152371 RepID=A0AAP0IU87_9MAGN
MALLSQQQLQRFLCINAAAATAATSSPSQPPQLKAMRVRDRSRWRCSAIAIDAAGASLTDVAGIRWGSSKLQGAREEMEDDVVIRSGDLGGSSHRRVWRRRKLTKKDERLQHSMKRVPFLEEQVRKIRETENLVSGDIARLLLSEENRFNFVNEVAAEAKAYVENNRDEYGSKKAILHVLSNRMNDVGFERPEAYMETDPFNPGQNYLREVL